YRMTNIQAAIGCAQLEQADAILARRKTIAAAYRTGLVGIPGLTPPPAEPWAETVYWMYSVLIEPAFGRSRADVMAGLRARGVDSRPFFVPLHEMPPHRLDAPFPVATSLGARGINLPSGTGLQLEEIATVCDALRALAAGRGAPAHDDPVEPRAPTLSHAAGVSVVLPTYNEREGIAELVAEILGVARRTGLEVEVLVVDDASPDGTAAHVETVFRADPAVRVHVRRGERGLASAIYRGIREARGDIVVVMDSDGNHDPVLLPLMVRCAEDFDVVIGSRYVLGGGMLTSRFRYWGSYAFNILIRIVLGLRIHDNLSGYLAFR